MVMGLWSNCLSIDLVMPRLNPLFPCGVNAPFRIFEDDNGKSKIDSYDNVMLLLFIIVVVIDPSC